MTTTRTIIPAKSGFTVMMPSQDEWPVIAWLTAVARHVLNLVDGTGTSNVVSLR